MSILVGKVSLFNNDYQEYEVFENKDEYSITYTISDICAMEFHTAWERPYIRIKSMECSKSNSGFFTVLICFLVHHLGYKLMSNVNMDTEELNLWKSFLEYRKIDVLNIISGDIIKYTPDLDMGADFVYLYTVNDNISSSRFLDVAPVNIKSHSVFGQKKSDDIMLIYPSIQIISFGRGQP